MRDRLNAVVIAVVLTWPHFAYDRLKWGTPNGQETERSRVKKYRRSIMTELGLEKFLTVIGFEKGAVTSKRGGQPQTGVIAEKIGATKLPFAAI